MKYIYTYICILYQKVDHRRGAEVHTPRGYLCSNVIDVYFSCQISVNCDAQERCLHTKWITSPLVYTILSSSIVIPCMA